MNCELIVELDNVEARRKVVEARRKVQASNPEGLTIMKMHLVGESEGDGSCNTTITKLMDLGLQKFAKGLQKFAEVE